MKHEPFSAPTTTQTPDRHRLNRDYETRSRLNLKKVGLARYAADPSTTIICMAYAVDDGPVQRWFPGDPVPPVWFEAANEPELDRDRAQRPVRERDRAAHLSRVTAFHSIPPNNIAAPKPRASRWRCRPSSSCWPT